MTRKVFLSLVAAMLAAGIAASGEKKGAEERAEAKLQVLQCAMKVSGMTCGGCARSAEARLAKIPGVKSAKVEFDSAEAKVEFDSKLTTPEKIVAAFNESGGFRAELAKEKSR